MSERFESRTKKFAWWGAAAAVVLALVGLGAAAPEGIATEGAGALGADVIVGDLPSSTRWGEVGGITAYSIGTTSCNVGDEDLLWIAGTNEHPVIGQNMYRLKDDRMEQVGMSWLKHGFLALALDLCDNCQDPGTGSLLGVGCSDPYGSGLNGDQDGFNGVAGLGPRFEVNADTGDYAFPYTDQGLSGNAIYKRLQVHNEDLDPTQNPGALYFVEGHYVTVDDAAAHNHDNNVSHRQVTVNGNFDLSMVGDTQREVPALLAWAAQDPDVAVSTFDVPGDGRMILASKVKGLGPGRWSYEYALYNMNSHRSARSFSVPVHPDAQLTQVGFHDVDYHSGEPYTNTDWDFLFAGGEAVWSTSTFDEDENANALRWGTTYNFRFVANSEPVFVAADVGLFRPGSPDTLGVRVLVPLGVPPPPEIFDDGFESGDTSGWSDTGSTQ